MRSALRHTTRAGTRTRGRLAAAAAPAPRDIPIVGLYMARRSAKATPGHGNQRPSKKGS